LFLRREGFPEDGEIVFCTVTKIQYHAITVDMDEYPGMMGLIPISEVSPGRIRNIRDFVEEGKKVVCKVIRIDESRGHIDLSLRRVNESQRRNKTDAIKQEQKAEKIIESFAEKLKRPAPEVYKEVAPELIKNYLWLHLAFEDVVEKNISLSSLGLGKEIAEQLEQVVKDKIKPKKVEIIEKISIKSYQENGLELIKGAFEKAKAVDKQVQFAYLGGGNYRLHVTAKDYKKAEAVVKEVQLAISKLFEGKKGEVSFERQEA
jgi:translation initiation factor 2 subunit 1